MKKYWDEFWKTEKIIYKPISIIKNLYFTRIKAKYIKSFLSRSYIIEVGCGDSKLLSLLPKENKIIGLDISSFALKKARNNLLNRNVSLKLCDAFKIDFNNNTFDLVLCDGLIEHYTDKIESLFKEMYRVTKIGGYLIIILTNKDFVRKMLFKYIYSWDRKKIKTTKEYRDIFNNVISRLSKKYKIEVVPKSLGLLMAVAIKKC